MTLDDLRPEFKDQILRLKRKLMFNLNPKLFNEKLINGDILSTMITSYVGND